MKPGIAASLATLLLAATALLSNAVFLGHSLRSHDSMIDNRDVGLYEKRFAPLKPHLPSHGVIGYFWEQADWRRWDWQYTQYALAPLVLDKTPDHPFVVANFPGGDVPPFVTTNRQFELMRDFGDGVRLYRNHAQ